jgi:hypothetical protein
MLPSARLACGRKPSRVLVVVLTMLVASQSWGKQPLTVADAIETARFRTGAIVSVTASNDVVELEDESPLVFSPDGKRFVTMLLRGDLARDGIQAELLVGAADGTSKPSIKTVTRLFTSALGRRRSTQLLIANYNPLLWLADNRHVAFRWEDDRGIMQAATVDVDTGRFEFITEHQTDVASFAIGAAGWVLYASEVARPRADDFLRRGFVVTNATAFGLLKGELDGYDSTFPEFERYVRKLADSKPRRILINGQNEKDLPSIAAFSPNGRYAIVEGPASDAGSLIRPYRPGDPQRTLFEAVLTSPRSPSARLIKQLFVLDLESGMSRPLWNVPNVPQIKVVWSPGGDSVLVGPTFLPTDTADELGMKGVAVAAVDVSSGRVESIPITLSDRRYNLEWHSTRLIRVTARNQDFYFSKDHGGWRSRQTQPLARRANDRIPSVQIMQELNTPPVLVASMANSNRRVLLDPNPDLLTKFTLGHVEMVHWVSDGREWSGRLYYPVDYVSGRRYPLVIQTHGHADENEFSLYGKGSAPGLGPGYSVYAAQPLANRGIAVLHVQDMRVPGIYASPREPELYMASYEAAIQNLVAIGLVDASRVGVVGWSRSGWHVQYALAHSQFTYAAAISADNYDAGYFQAALVSWNATHLSGAGAQPFGDGLKEWLKRVPEFNVERMHTPLRLQSESEGLPKALAAWGIFTRLRALRKPVELYVIPNINEGSHTLQNPTQCLAAQQGAVDWFDFWLNGYEDRAADKAEQYARWRELRRLRDLDQAAHTSFRQR